MCIEYYEKLGCNLFFLKIKPSRDHTDAYRRLKVPLGYLAHAVPDSTRNIYMCVFLSPLRKLRKKTIQPIN